VYGAGTDAAVSGLPQLLQNCETSSFDVPHWGQNM
jgi:hypothetical protein